MHTIEINLPDTIVVEIGRKAKFGTINLEAAKLSAEIVAKLALHGLKQKANDPIGAKDIADSAKLGLAQKVIDALIAGEWSARGGARDVVVPTLPEAMATEARRILVNHIRKALPASAKAADIAMALEKACAARGMSPDDAVARMVEDDPKMGGTIRAAALAVIDAAKARQAATNGTLDPLAALFGDVPAGGEAGGDETDNDE